MHGLYSRLDAGLGVDGAQRWKRNVGADEKAVRECEHTKKEEWFLLKHTQIPVYRFNDFTDNAIWFGLLKSAQTWFVSQYANLSWPFFFSHSGAYIFASLFSITFNRAIFFRTVKNSFPEQHYELWCLLIFQYRKKGEQFCQFWAVTEA